MEIATRFVINLWSEIIIKKRTECLITMWNGHCNPFCNKQKGRQWTGIDTITYHLPSKTSKRKKDALKATTPRSNHYKQKAKRTVSFPKIGHNGRPKQKFRQDIHLKHTMTEIEKKKVQGVPQSQAAALPRHQEEEKNRQTKQAQIEQTYEKH